MMRIYSLGLILFGLLVLLGIISFFTTGTNMFKPTFNSTASIQLDLDILIGTGSIILGVYTYAGKKVSV